MRYRFNFQNIIQSLPSQTEYWINKETVTSVGKIVLEHRLIKVYERNLRVVIIISPRILLNESWISRQACQLQLVVSTLQSATPNSQLTLTILRSHCQVIDNYRRLLIMIEVSLVGYHYHACCVGICNCSDMQCFDLFVSVIVRIAFRSSSVYLWKKSQ